MVREMRKCGGSGKAKIMEKAVEEEKEAAGGGRKRKIVLGESELSTTKTRRLAVKTPESSSSPVSSRNSTSCESVNSGYVLASCCSSSRSSEMVEDGSKFADLEVCMKTVNKHISIIFNSF